MNASQTHLITDFHLQKKQADDPQFLFMRKILRTIGQTENTSSRMIWGGQLHGWGHTATIASGLVRLLCVCVDEFDWTSTCTKRRKQAAGNELEIESQTFLLGYSVEEAIFFETAKGKVQKKK